MQSALVSEFVDAGDTEGCKVVKGTADVLVGVEIRDVWHAHHNAGGLAEATLTGDFTFQEAHLALTGRAGALALALVVAFPRRILDTIGARCRALPS